MRDPDIRDFPYGPHERHRLDLWRADSDVPAPLFVYIHGGGFMTGDKTYLHPGGLPEFMQAVLDAGMGYAAVNYRLSDAAIHPAQMHDAARALQTIRSRAGEWGVDPGRIGCTGGSAGAGISLWLAFHPDMAQPDADDAVLRFSSRANLAVALNAQCSYDPREVRKIVPGDAYDHVALKKLVGLDESWDWDRDTVSPEIDALLRDVSPITHLAPDAAPVFVMQFAAANVAGNIHHGNFGRYLKEKMDEAGVECVSRMDSDYADRDDTFIDECMAFVKKHFAM
ncbi:MAG: alpha/beta hydrolase [Planctomycetes bacterium]|nr:alpha/beta hydrolase [Planctomycetota bacterium]